MGTKFHWTTEFNTSRKTITHKFEDNTTVLANTETERVKIFKDGVLISEDSLIMNPKEYTKYLYNIELSIQEKNKRFGKTL